MQAHTQHNHAPPSQDAPTLIKTRGKKCKDLPPMAVDIAQNASTGGSNFAVASSGLSRLECLPYECLKQIFLESLNINLTRASAWIGASLSNKSTYYALCRKIFLCECQSSPLPIPSSTVDTTPSHQHHNRHEHVRTLALQCRWATFRFFQDFAVSTRHSQNDFPLYSCSVPAKLLKWPLSTDNRRLLFALIAAGAQMDLIDSLDGERVEALWRSAVKTMDVPLLQCLMDDQVGFEPSALLKRWAVQVTRYNLDLILLFRQRSHYNCGRKTVSKTPSVPEALHPKWFEIWLDNCPDDWPESDPVLTARLYEAFAVDCKGLRKLMSSKASRWEWRDDGGTVDCRIWNAID